MEDLRYPIGHVKLPDKMELSHIKAWIHDVAQAPTLLRQAVMGLSEEQLNTPYRPGGWTVRQIVHHLPDSHAVTYVNFRRVLTEEGPLMVSANVDAWGSLEDAAHGDIHMSLDLFTALHARWGRLLQSMNRTDFERVLESSRGPRPISFLLGIYAWHGKHHAAQITSLRDRMGW